MSKKPQKQEKIQLTNRDLQTIADSIAFAKQRQSPNIKNKLRFRRWVKGITENSNYKAFTELYTENIQKLSEKWKTEIIKAKGKDFFNSLQEDEEKANRMFNVYLFANQEGIKKGLRYDEPSGIEIEKYIFTESELASDLTDFEIETLERFFDFK